MLWFHHESNLPDARIWIFHAKIFLKNPISRDQYWDSIAYTQTYNDSMDILHFQN